MGGIQYKEEGHDFVMRMPTSGSPNWLRRHALPCPTSAHLHRVLHCHTEYNRYRRHRRSYDLRSPTFAHLLHRVQHCHTKSYQDSQLEFCIQSHRQFYDYICSPMQSPTSIHLHIGSYIVIQSPTQSYIQFCLHRHRQSYRVPCKVLHLPLNTHTCRVNTCCINM